VFHETLLIHKSAGTSEPPYGFERVFSADDLQIKSWLEADKLRHTVSFRGNSGGRNSGCDTDRKSYNCLILNQYQLYLIVSPFLA
jgi:hypothetical protein